MEIYRTDKSKGCKRGFTRSDNAFITNPNLSAKAKGIFEFLLHLPDDYKPSIAGITANMKDSYSSIRSGLDELIKHGYLDLIELADEDKNNYGKHYHFIVYEISSKENPKKALEGVSNLDTPHNENPNLITTKNKDNISIFIKDENDLEIVEEDLIENKNAIISHIKLSMGGDFNNHKDPDIYNYHIKEFLSHLRLTVNYDNPKTIKDYRRQFIYHIKFYYKI